MARSAQLAMRGFGQRLRFGGDTLTGVQDRVFAVLGALLVLVILLLVLALLLYLTVDASFASAVAAPPRSFLGDAAPIVLPVAMTEAARVAVLLLSIIGLSPGDWRVIGGGAGRGAARLARVSG